MSPPVQIVLKRKFPRTRLITGLIRLAGAALVIVAGLLAHSQLAFTQGPRFAAEQVRPNLYRVSGEGGNVAVYVTEEGVILVDDMYDRNYQAIMDQVRKLTVLPIRYVLDTHEHDDHAGGNQNMREMAGALVISHENARANMAALRKPGVADITFSRRTKVHLGGKTVEMHYFGRGHTSGDAIILFPELRTIHSGDLFLSGGRMFVDYAQGGSAVDWPATLDGALTLDFDTVIPGHGPVADRAEVQKWRNNFAAMNQRMQSMVRGGANKAEVSAVMSSDYGWPEGGLAIQQVDAFIEEMR